MLKYDLQVGKTSSSSGYMARPAWADVTGLIASVGCAIHCAAMPIIIGYLPALGLNWVATPGFHQGMAIICSLLAIAAFVPGWRKHRKFLPAMLGLVGIALLTSHAFGSNDCCADVACAEQSCELCVESEPNSTAQLALSQKVTSVSSSSTAGTSFWKSLNWFVTPLGGCMLIIAHLANHRFACRCCRGEQPCGTEPVASPTRDKTTRSAFTLVELLVVISIIAMLVALLLPAVQATRGAARKIQCTNNIRQLALAFQLHHNSKGYFPKSEVGSGELDGHGGCGGGMYSWHARILPYIEESALHESIDFGKNMADSCTAGQDGTISQLHSNANAAAHVVETFLCPSDGATGSNHVVMGSASPASDNYAANAGWPTATTGIRGTHESPMKYNGLVTLQNPAKPDLRSVAQSPVRIRNVVDGLSKTAAISERLIQTAIDRDSILTGDERLMSFHITTASRSMKELVAHCNATTTHADAQQSAYLGRAWISGWSPTGATYRHLRTPNTTNCHFGDSFTSGEFMVTPSSNHAGGVNVAMADGHVQFVTDDIEPGIWWSMGNRNDGIEQVANR